MPLHHHENDKHPEHEHHHDESNALLIDHVNLHSMNMWKGLIAMMGFVTFFFTEKALNMISEWRKHWQHKKKVNKRRIFIFVNVISCIISIGEIIL